MKRKLHFLLAVGIGLMASVGWLHAEGKLVKDENVTFKEKSGFTFVYAQGNPVTVSAGTDGKTLIKVDGDNEQFEIAADKVNQLYLFGGSKNGTVASTKITIESGTIASVFGGGYGELTSTSDHAVVSDTSKIIVKGGSIHNIIGGGLYYSKSRVVKIDISNVTMDNNAWVICGGLESGKTSGSIYPEFSASTNTVESGILNITGGTFCYIGIGGTDGAKGYVKKAEANISKANIVGLFGNGSNGASDDVKGKVTGCTFAAMGSDYPVEVAAINRGHVKNVKLEFDGCKFPAGETFCYVGGTAKWKKDYKGSEVEVVTPGKISYSFTGCTNTPVLGLSDGLNNANVEVTGAKVKIAPFNNGVDSQVTTFAIGAGKTWTFNNGLLSDDGVTLTVEEKDKEKGVLNNMFFANGTPVTIEARDGGKEGAKIGTEEYDNTLSVFGGSLNASVTNSNITMNSGSIRNLYGGGYGAGNKTSGTQANVTNKTTIEIKGGTISNILVGGGYYYSKSPEVDMTISGGRIATLYAGGYDQGNTQNTLESTWENCVNGVKTFKLTMTGGTITEGLGCGGGQGYAHTDSSYVKISDATLAAFYGVLSNGSARTIKAELDNCIFSAIGEYYEFASVNRGKAGKIDFTFDACSFNNLDKIYANLGAVDGWASSDTDGKIVPAVTDRVKFTFTNSKTSTPVMKVGQGLGETDIELTGAVAKIDSALVSDKNGTKQWHNEFTLGEGKTWTFNDGLTMASGVTLAKTGTLVNNGPFEANVSTVDELKAAISVGADVVNLADGTYELGETLTLGKGTVLQGTDTAKCIIKGAIAIQSTSTDTIDIVVNDVKFDYAPAGQNSNTRCTPVIEVHKGKVNLQVNNCLVNNNTAGTADRTADDFKYLYNVFQMDSLASGSMTIKNCEINLNANNQIGVLAEAANCTVLLKDTKIQTAKTTEGNPKGNSNIGIFPHNNGVIVTMDNSTIELMNHYGIYMWSGDNAGKDEKPIEDLKVYLKNKSAISAYGAIRVRYTKNTYLSLTGGSTLTGSTFNAKGGSNDFGALVMQGNTGAVVDIEDSNIGTAFGREDAAAMTPILFNNYYGLEKGTIINLKGSTVIQTQSNDKAPYMVKYSTYPDPDTLKSYVRVAEGASVKFLDETGKDCIIIKDHADKSFRNAAVSVASAIYFDDYPVANPGDVVLATDTTMAKALLSLNATDWGEYVIPDSVIIECKDGYLVTGENAANVFANSVNDKAVFYLKQSEKNFTPVAAGNNRKKIANNTIWNDAGNANRSVEIATGATLTINVAMPLDTVFMAEGAQLVADANVTAKAVQLTYDVKTTWKAFGFPFASPSVTDLKGKAVTTAAQDAATGLWTATIKDAEPVFEVTTSSATPVANCIIAADQDSTILVTSTGAALISLTSKAEPNAPVPTKSNEVKFQIVSNPNTYDMALTQTAYVLSEDGKTFERAVNPTIKAFQSFVLADEGTTNTLRSLRVGETPTGNEIIVPTEGYYVQTGRGTITIHTAEPVQVTVVDMLGRVYYNARVTDGYQINVPAGIYAVNRQKVIVK